MTEGEEEATNLSTHELAVVNSVSKRVSPSVLDRREAKV